MHLGITRGLYLGITCPACGAIGRHDRDCPKPTIDMLRSRQLHEECPECGKRDVDRNDSDFMECRQCHTQYRRANAYDDLGTGRWVLLDLRTDPDMAHFFVLDQKGTGEFSIDVALKEAIERFRIMSEGKGKSRKKKRH